MPSPTRSARPVMVAALAGLASGCHLQSDIDRLVHDVAFIAGLVGAIFLATFLQRSRPGRGHLVGAIVVGLLGAVVAGLAALHALAAPHRITDRDLLALWVSTPLALLPVAALLRSASRGGQRAFAVLLGLSYLGLLLATTKAVLGQPFPGPPLEVRFTHLSQVFLLPGGRVVADADGLRVFSGGFVATATSGDRVYALGGDGRVLAIHDTLVRPADVGVVAGLPPMASLAGSSAGVCGVSRDRVAYCWHAPAHREAPFRIDLEGATKVSVGSSLACALDASSSLWCWWATLADPRPFRVAGVEGARDLSVGGASACVIDANGRVRCFAVADADEGRKVEEVADVDHALTVGAGSEHVCALDASHRVLCWGGNGAGELGDGQREAGRASAEPVELPGPARSLMVEALVTCAGLEDGRFFCWGQRRILPVRGIKAVVKGIVFKEDYDEADRPGELLLPPKIFGAGAVPAGR